MLRKLVLLNAPHLLDDLIKNAQAAGYDLDDSGFIGPKNEGYDFEGRRSAMVSVVYDDAEESKEQVIAKIQAIHGSFLVHRNWVYMPDAMEKEWYEAMWPRCEALRVAEESGDVATAAALRAEIAPQIEAAVEKASAFLTGWMLDMGQALGGIELPDGQVNTHSALKGVSERLNEIKREEG